MAAAVVILALLSLAAFCAARFELTTEITHFLPTRTDRSLVNLSRAITDSELTRRMILTVGAPDGSCAVAAGADLAEKLAGHPQVDWIRSSPNIGAEHESAIYDLYFPRRHLLLSSRPEVELPERLSDQGLRRAARQIKRAFELGAAPFLARTAGADPLGSFGEQLERFRGMRDERLRSVEGGLVSADGRHGIALLASRASAFRSGDQRELLDAIQEAFDEVNADHGGGLVLEQSSFSRFAVAAELSIRRDIRRISILSTVAAVLLFLLVFRSPRFVLLLVVSLAAGLVTGLSVCLAVFGKVHGITMAFGASLIGVCIDYPIHLFNHHTLHPAPGGPAETLKRIWGAVALGAFTTIAGLAGMAWTSFPGIREIAVFAPAGVLGALITTRVVLPPFMPHSSSPGGMQRLLAGALAAATDAMQRRRALLYAIVAAALLIAVLGLPAIQWNDDLASLNSFDSSLMEEDQRVRERVTSMDTGRFAIAIAADEETALGHNDALYLRLEEARAEGLLGAFRSLHSVIWSAQLQNRNLAQVREATALAARAQAAFVAEGFRDGALDPFAETLRGEAPTALTLDELRTSPLAPMVETFLLSIPPDGGVGILTFLRRVEDSDALARRLADLEGVVYLDQAQYLREVYGGFRVRTQQLVVAGLLAVLALVWVRYRRLRNALAAFLPAVLAAAATLGACALLGIELNLLSLVGTLLVLSMGVDYGIFMVDTHGEREARLASLLSIVIASLTTVLSFGLMGLSDNPALRALGLTTSLGSLSCVLLTPVVVALLASRPGAR